MSFFGPRISICRVYTTRTGRFAHFFAKTAKAISFAQWTWMISTSFRSTYLASFLAATSGKILLRFLNSVNAWLFDLEISASLELGLNIKSTPMERSRSAKVLRYTYNSRPPKSGDKQSSMIFIAGLRNSIEIESVSVCATVGKI